MVSPTAIIQKKDSSKPDQTMIVILEENMAQVGGAELLQSQDGRKILSVKSVSGPYQINQIDDEYENYHGSSYYTKRTYRSSIYILLFILFLVVFGLGLFVHIVSMHDSFEVTTATNNPVIVTPAYHDVNNPDELNFEKIDDNVAKIQPAFLEEEESFPFEQDLMDSWVSSIFSPIFEPSSDEILPGFPFEQFEVDPNDESVESENIFK